jgi:hypothetical protein
MDEGAIMIRTSNRQRVCAATAVIAFGAAVWLSGQSTWLLAARTAASHATDADHVSMTQETASAAGGADTAPADDVAARAMRESEAARFETFARGDAQGTVGDLAAGRSDLDAEQLHPDAMIAQAAGNGYAAIGAPSRPAAPPVATKR